MEKLAVSKDKKAHYIHLAVWAIIQIIIWNIPPAGALTVTGVHTLAAFIGLLYGLCFVKQYAIPCIMCPLIMTFSGAFDGGVISSYAAGFSSDPFVMMFSILMISGVVQYSGLAKELAVRILNAKFTKGRPWALTFCILFASTVLALFIHPIVIIAIMSELVIDIFRKLKMKGNRWTLFMLLDICVCGIQAPSTMPFQQGPTLMFSVMGAYDNRISILNYAVPNMVMNGVITLSLMLFCFFITWLLCRSCVDQVKNYIPEASRPFTEDMKIALGILISYVIIQLVPQFLPDSTVKTFLVSPSVTGYSALFACIAMFIRKRDGNKFITFEQISSRGMNWFALLMLVGLGPVCAAMTSDTTGILQWLTDIVQPLCDGMSPYGLFVFLCAFCLIATNIIDNIAVIFAIIPVIYVVCVGVGANPAAMLSALFPAIQMGIALPGGTPHIAMIFAKEDTGYVSFGKLCRWSLVRIGVVFLISITLGWLMMGLFVDPFSL